MKIGFLSTIRSEMTQFCRPPRPVRTLSARALQEVHSTSEFIINHEDIESIRVIGSGAFGEVSEGLYKPRNEKVAIKKLHIVKPDARNEELFHREIETLSRVKHPFLLPFVGYTDSPPFYILTKFISNGSLYNELHQDKDINLSGTDLTVIAYGISAGMTYLHSLDVLHRDLKTQNVLLNKHKMPIICDFGSSRKAEAQKTMTMNSAGTSNYMAPEFFVGGHYNKEVDVYSFGMMLWEMLTKEVPFYGFEAPQVIYTVVIQKQRPDIPENTPPRLKQLIEMCWAQEPSERPQFDRIKRLFETGEVQFPGNNPIQFKESLELYLRKNKSKNSSSRSSSKPQLMPFMNMPKHVTTTPPLPKMSRHRDSLPVCLNNDPSMNSLKNTQNSISQRVNAYLLTLSPTTQQLNVVLEYFSQLVDTKTMPAAPIWEPFLEILCNTNKVNPPELVPQIFKLTEKFAQNHSILDKIQSVPNLQAYIHDNTLDVFLYAVTFVPQAMTSSLVNSLIEFTLKTETSTSKAITLLFKIFSMYDLMKAKIFIFFRKNALSFVNKDGGNIILKALMNHHITNDTNTSADVSFLAEIITAYAHSSIQVNVIAAYEATFCVSWGRAEFFALKDVLANMVSDNERLRKLSFEFIRKFADGAMGAPLEMICSSLLKAACMYGDEEAIILLCCVAAKPGPTCQILLSSAKTWLMVAEKSLLFLKLFMVLMKNEIARDYLLSIQESYKFLINVIKIGPPNIFLVILYIIKIYLSKMLRPSTS
ncbi:TKL family protein kinase [Tritrichomonas foetus]|uniref:TKL family protein kinase n=1 Tax=Tritrichomonas foetus TaxID=1144522 RepID=A0A1J4KTN3_9EUKA|nr:TKL family protein kinase [Tritrichomonas foetus]|eukprot:OHT14256.1 TKL family protein kinase [Tritrichomonas foetus]